MNTAFPAAIGPRASSPPQVQLHDLAILLDGHGYRVLELGDYTVTGERRIDARRTRAVTFHLNRLATGWIGAIHVLEVARIGEQPGGLAAPKYRRCHAPKSQSEALRTLSDARDWLAKVEHLVSS